MSPDQLQAVSRQVVLPRGGWGAGRGVGEAGPWTPDGLPIVGDPGAAVPPVPGGTVGEVLAGGVARGGVPSRDQIAGWYQQYLGRPVSPDEITNWQQGTYGPATAGMQQQIASSGEAQAYAQAAPPPGRYLPRDPRLRVALPAGQLGAVGSYL
jgi:hypothetical protein